MAIGFIIKEQKNIQQKITMSHPPKIVKVDLLKQLKKTRTSPNKKSINQSPRLTKQFSFSNDLQNGNNYSKQSYKQSQSSPLAKKLFKDSYNKQKNNQNCKPKTSPSKQNMSRIRQKYKDYNANYEQVDEQDRFFKKSIDKLKTSFFKSDGMSKQTTKKILKEIGKYAENRSKSKQKKQNNNTKLIESKYSNFPIEFYGFKTKDEKIRKTRQQRQQVERGTFLDFERAYELTIADNNQKIKSMNYKSVSVKYTAIQQKHNINKQRQFKSSEVYQQGKFDQIGEKQINIICEIFQCADKLDEDDTLTHQDVTQLCQQFQTKYHIKNSQINKIEENNKHVRMVRFNNLLRDFQDDLKVIFYRKQQNNVYDTLYYLRQTNHLRLVCQDFIKIKNTLQL